MHKNAVIFAVALALAPIRAQAADLVVSWQEGIYPQEDAALAEVIATFEKETGKQVEVTLLPLPEQPPRIKAMLEAGHPPDFAFGFWLVDKTSRWALEDRLLDLADTVGDFSDLFDPDQLDRAMLFNATTGRRALYGLPMGQIRNHIHVWKSLLERAGLSLDEIPKEWKPFWTFWCDQAQPAVRKALGRDDIWAIGRPMSVEAADTTDQFLQFVDAYEADYITRDGRLVIDDPEIRRRLVEAMASYTAVYRKGCTPPDSLTWDDGGNNRAFLGQSVMMTANMSLSIPNALKADRPDDYYDNTATIEWPLGPDGDAFPIETVSYAAVVFKEGGNVETAKEFVRFLVAEGWLMHYLDFSGERMLPSIAKLLDQPFWLDPSDRHHMAAAMQAKARPSHHSYPTGDPRYDQIYSENENVWSKAVHRVAADGTSPEQAVDEAIARIKEILDK
jgi:multiple sugar transport system substrate-binding protein